MLKFSRVILPMALTVCGIANAADFTVDGLTYTTLSETTVSVKKFVEGSDVVIPAKVADPATNTEYDVVQIERQAFYNAAVTSISVPASVKHVEPYAFWKATAESVKFADGTETIGYGAFRECTRLTSVTLPETLKELGSVWDVTGLDGAAFHGCTALQEITIPASITVLPQLTFCECSNLSKVNLPETLTEIGDCAFELCSSLKTFNFPASVTTLGGGVFNKSGLVNPTVPGSIKIIPNSAFLWCQKMTGFTIEEGIVEVGKQSFAACYGFTKIEVPNSVEWIRTDAFQANDNVTEIHIGSGIRRLGHASLAVWGPDEKTNTPHWKLKEIHIDSPVPPVHEQNDDHFEIVDDDFFFGAKEFTETLRRKFYAEVKLYVPEEAVDVYRNADIWKNFVFINDNVNDDKGIDDVESGRKLSVTDGIATFDGQMEIYDAAGTVRSATGTFDLNTLGTGIYIVRAGGQTVKTAIR